MKKSKNQLILDKAMEDEFVKTMKIFDDFTEYLVELDFRAHVRHIDRLEQSSDPNAKKEKELFGEPKVKPEVKQEDAKLLSAAFPTPAM